MSGRRQMVVLGSLLVVSLVLLLAGLLEVDRMRPAPRVRPRPEKSAESRQPENPVPKGLPFPAQEPPDAQAPGMPVLTKSMPESRNPRVRFRDGVSGEILTKLEEAGIRAVMTGRTGPSFTQNLGIGAEPDSDGWVRMYTLPEDDSIDATRSFIEVTIHGYERVRLEGGAPRDMSEIPLVPWLPTVRGTMVGPEGAPGKVRAVLLAEIRDETLGSLRPRGLPASTGPFEIHDLPDGRWILWAWSTGPGGTFHAVRRFERSGNVVDLGEVRLDGWSSLRVRVVDGQGGSVSDTRLVGRPTLPGTDFMDMIIHPVPGGLPSSVEVEGGWLLFDHLPPGMDWTIRSVTLPGVEIVARTPEEPGAVRSVEIPWMGRRVRCRLRFTADGEEQPGWGRQIFLNGIEPAGWKADGRVETVLASGAYTVMAWKEGYSAKGAGGPFTRGPDVRVELRGEFTVPAEEAFEAVVDLKSPVRPESR